MRKLIIFPIIFSLLFAPVFTFAQTQAELIKSLREQISILLEMVLQLRTQIIKLSEEKTNQSPIPPAQVEKKQIFDLKKYQWFPKGSPPASQP